MPNSFLAISYTNTPPPGGNQTNPPRQEQQRPSADFADSRRLEEAKKQLMTKKEVKKRRNSSPLCSLPLLFCLRESAKSADGCLFAFRFQLSAFSAARDYNVGHGG
jgi:hypothetical protein